MRKRFSGFRKKASVIGASVLIGTAGARAQTNRIAHARTNSVREAKAHASKPQINFFYCAHEMGYFNFPQYKQAFENAKREGNPYNTMLLELSDLPHAEKKRIERITDKNADALVALSKKIIENQRGAYDKALDKKYFQEFHRMCPINNEFVLHTLLVAYANDVRRVRAIESYSEKEIETHFRLNTGKEMPPQEYIIKFAQFIKFRNQRMGETIYKIRMQSEKDPYYSTNGLNALVILGAGHGGFNLEHGAHNEFAKEVRAKGGATSIGVLSTYNKQIKPTNYRELLELEAVKLAQKSPEEIANYKIPKPLLEFGENLLKRQKR